ncbi:MAG: rod shape-determining protein MreD [Candidatus Hatepunaea meridiana]|nr:rod shape-determining protein MreD [Candidatus Hatepunaea meridiana]
MLIEIVKTFIYGVIVLIAQIGLSPLLEISGVKPDLLMIFVMLLMVRNGAYAGLIAGFMAGIAQDLISIGITGVLALAKSTIAFWLGRLLGGQDTSLKPTGWFLLLSLASLVHNFFVSLFLLQGSDIGLFEYLIKNVIPSSLYTGIIGYIWILLPFGRKKPEERLLSRTRRDI